MVRNIVVLGGSSHPQLTRTICDHLGVPPGDIALGKFACGETRVEIGESVRGKDVFVIQSGGGRVNDHLIELLIIISACKTASAKKITAILPLFPYSKQSDDPYNKIGAPLAKVPLRLNSQHDYTFESRPETPLIDKHEGFGVGPDSSHKQMYRHSYETPNGIPSHVSQTEVVHNQTRARRSNTQNSGKVDHGDYFNAEKSSGSKSHSPQTELTPVTSHTSMSAPLPSHRGYKQWVAQAGTLVADLITCAGADHVITMDLHDPQYQGFFDIPVDNLYGKHLLRKYIQQHIPNYKDAIIVSPDAGGAKRATAIAEPLNMHFALIHKERRPAQIVGRENATMMLVGNVHGKTAILVDDLADTSNTITRAAKLLKAEGAIKIYALVTHGVLSGDAIDRINASALDKVVVTNSVPQDEHRRRCPKLEVLEVGTVFAEAIRRVHHGESISVLFQHD